MHLPHREVERPHRGGRCSSSIFTGGDQGCQGAGRQNILDVLEQPTRRATYFAVGIANSAPFSVLSGQRCMIDFCFV